SPHLFMTWLCSVHNRRSTGNWLVLSVGLIHFSTAFGQDIYRDRSESEGATHFFTKAHDAQLEQAAIASGPHVNFSFHAVSPPPDPGWAYMLVVNVRANGGVIISEGATLTLMPDNQEPLSLSG